MIYKFKLIIPILMTALLTSTILPASETNSNEYVISSGENFAIYSTTKDNQPEYRYEIYNKNGIVIKNESVWKAYPNIMYVSNNTLLSISVGVGTGTFLTQYYDVNRDLFSEMFESPALAAYGNVVYMDISDDTIKLVVRDIFDKSKFYKEFELDFSPVANPTDALRDVEFLDKDTIKISYLSGVGYDEKTSLLKLN